MYLHTLKLILVPACVWKTFLTQFGNNHSTVEPPNKGQYKLSFIERLSSFRGSKTIGHIIFGTSNSVLCREVIIQSPYFGGSTISEVPLYYARLPHYVRQSSFN